MLWSCRVGCTVLSSDLGSLRIWHKGYEDVVYVGLTKSLNCCIIHPTINDERDTGMTRVLIHGPSLCKTRQMTSTAMLRADRLVNGSAHDTT